MSKTVVVAGAGFAGIQAARVIGRTSGFRVMVIDRIAGTTMLPALPDVAAGFMEPSLVSTPVEKVVDRGVEFVNGCVTEVNLDERTVSTDDTQLGYDGLVIATGSAAAPVKLPDYQAAFFHRLASLEDALAIQRDFTSYLGRAKAPHLLFAGTGYTGIELAVCLKARAEAPGKRCRVTMVDPNGEILPFLTKAERRYVTSFLSSRDIVVHTGVIVKEMDGETATLSSGATVAAPFAVWSAGSVASLSAIVGDVKRIRDGRIIVNDFLQIENYPEVFVAGDACAFSDSRGQLIRKSVNYAYSGGKIAGRNCVRKLKGLPLHPFKPSDPGWVIPLHETGVGRLFNAIHIKGHLPLRLHYFMCGYRNYRRNRFRTALIALTLFKRKGELMRDLFLRLINTAADRSIGFVMLRVFTGIGMMTHGYGKVFGNPERFLSTVENIGFPFPGFFAFAASFSEFFGALLLCCGVLTRVWAFFIACTMSVAAFIVHGGDPFARKELALLYLFVALFFMMKGGGTFSIDYLIERKTGGAKEN
jgi:NADH:ubiquinone reductase (H+-translocating)